MADENINSRVLSIQSHVVYGYVGNKSAVFPLQLLGIEVDIINSVQFSNHSGYPHIGGKHLRLLGSDLLNLVQGLDQNHLLNGQYTHLLTGYIGSSELLYAILKVYDQIKTKGNQCLQYVCDPVLGDHGKLYVPSELVDIYRKDVLPIAHVLTPNQYECELLSELKIKTIKDAQKACIKLHNNGPKVVVITSFEEVRDVQMQLNDNVSRELMIIGSQAYGEQMYEQYSIRIPYLEGRFSGTGDLFTSLLLAWLTKVPDNFCYALEMVVSTIQHVLRFTLAHTVETESGWKELKLVQSRAQIMEPVKICTAIELPPIQHHNM